MVNIQKIVNVIKAHRSFLVSTHVNPDPDGLCSELALADVLKKVGKKVVIMNAEPVPSRYRFLPGAGAIRSYHAKSRFPFEVAIILDCGELNRIGQVEDLIDENAVIINIDHHVTNDRFGDFKLVQPEASSTAEVLYGLIKMFPAKLNPKMAFNLYAGILTDTGCFRYENTSSRTLHVAGELRKFPFDAYGLYQRFYEVIPLEDMKILTTLLSQARIYHKRVMCIELSKKTIASFSDGFDLKDTIFKFFRSFDSIEIFVIMTEVRKNLTRVNFRARKSVDVAKLANRFGGGGHRKASGCMIPASMAASKKKILNAVKGLL